MVDRSDFHASSPVPADQFLWDDEKPFTAFGQFGEDKLDMRVFEQDVWWIDIHGQEHLLEEMSTDYLNNVVRHLFENLEHFHLGNGLRFSIERLLTVLPFDGAPRNFDQYIDYVENKESPLELPSAAWLNATPLVTRIWAILDARSAEAA